MLSTPVDPHAVAGSALLGKLPDAYAALHAPVRVEPDRSLRGRQQRRRSEIFCAARCQIAEGQWQVNVAALAERCGMAIQTVYNLAGDRHDILAAAVDEHYVALVSTATANIDSGHDIHAIGEALWGAALLNPEYMRNLSRAFFQQSDVVKKAIEKRILVSLQHAFSRTPVAVGRLSSDIRTASGRLHALLALSAFEWMNDRITLDSLRYRVREDIEIVTGRLLRH